MPILDSDRLRYGDLDAWKTRAKADAVHASLRRFRGRVQRALDDIEKFAMGGPCWAGTSWGKDSTVVAHLCAILHAKGRASVPLVWFVAGAGLANPDCYRVRDAFLEGWPVAGYEEVPYPLRVDDQGDWHGFAGVWPAYHRANPRHVMGFRAAENARRSRRMMTYGVSTESTCAPIGWWSDEDVFAYLHHFGLPVHPAYAMSMGGLKDRARIRVDRIGGHQGRGRGRLEWERAYYGDVLDNAREGE